jgi:hypothetical protein
MSLSNFPNGISSLGSPILTSSLIGTSEVHYACHSTYSSADNQWYLKMYKNVEADKMHTTIQSAVDACVSGRGDAVIVGPHTKIQQSLNTYNKKAIKIISAIHSWENQWRASDASSATKLPYTPTGYGSAVGGVCVAILSRSIEVCGFLFDHDGAYTGVYIGDGDLLVSGGGTPAVADWTNENSAGAWVHDNWFRSGGSGVGINLEGCGTGWILERNVIDNALYGILIGEYSSRATQTGVIRDNMILCANAGYGIQIANATDNSNWGTMIYRNFIADTRSRAATMGINSATTTGAVPIGANTIACAPTKCMALQSTDTHSGNSKGTQSATEVYIDED